MLDIRTQCFACVRLFDMKDLAPALAKIASVRYEWFMDMAHLLHPQDLSVKTCHFLYNSINYARTVTFANVERGRLFLRSHQDPGQELLSLVRDGQADARRCADAVAVPARPPPFGLRAKRLCQAA